MMHLRLKNIMASQHRNNPTLLLCLMGILSLGLILPASAARVYSWVTPDTLTLGDPIQIGIAAVVEKGISVIPPEIQDGTFGDFTINEWSSHRQEGESQDSIVFTYLATAYDTKADTIPSLTFLATRNDSIDTLVSPMLTARVFSVLDPDSLKTDSLMIKNLKAQQIAGSRSWAWLWITLAACALAGLGALIYSRRMKKSRAAESLPPKPPYEEAIEALQALEAKRYIKLGYIREYVFGLSEILKRYVERRYGVHAVEFTTEEMLLWISDALMSPENRQRLHWFFTTTEPVKYARFIPDDLTLERFADETRVFLESTRPRPESETDSSVAEKEMTPGETEAVGT